MSKIFLTEKQINDRLYVYRIKEDQLNRIDVQVIPHYGWLPCLSLHFSSCSPLSPHNNTKNLGFILQTFLQLFDIREDGEYLSKICNKKVRLVYSVEGFHEECVAVGHPYKDRYVFFSDLMKVSDTYYD